MTSEFVRDPRVFFEELGGMHDARITNLSWNVAAGILTLGIDDLYSNFLGLPGYQEKGPVDLVFIGVTSVSVEVLTIDAYLAIDDTELSGAEGQHLIHLQCSPSGNLRFQFKKVRAIEKSTGDAVTLIKLPDA